MKLTHTPLNQIIIQRKIKKINMNHQNNIDVNAEYCPDCFQDKNYCEGDSFYQEVLTSPRWRNHILRTRRLLHPTLLPNRQIRREAYAQYIALIRTRGTHVGGRQELPGCVTYTIRGMYPEPNDAYVGFRADEIRERVRVIDRDRNTLPDLWWEKTNGL